jgi:flagellar hook-associated protein 1 FlgK
MGLDAGLAIANSGLYAIGQALTVVSQNVANAGTPGYAAERANQESLSAGGLDMGVRVLPTTLAVDTELQAELLGQNATTAALTTTQTALQAIDPVLGTPGSGTDLASMLGKLSDAFSSLSNNPADATQQTAVVTAASNLSQSINTLAGAYAAQRQSAQDAITSDVSALNTTLASIGALNTEIVALQATGQSTADLENQRSAAVQGLSSLVSLVTVPQSNGNLLLYSASGISLPTSGGTPFVTSDATLGAGSYYPGGGIPPITCNGVDVTAGLGGGRIGANVALRDNMLPAAQAGLDEFAQGLASRFDAQGLRLFSDPTGAVPSSSGMPVQSGYVGFSATIQVNPAVQADATLVRDGTQVVAGSTTGASAFTPNPAGGPAGFQTLITRVLDYALGADTQAGVSQPAFNITGLGPAGNLSSGYAVPPSLAGLASALVAAQAAQSSQASSQAGDATALQTSLQTKLSTASGVNIDTEMSTMIKLQNAYGANAHILTAAQAMWNQLLQAVQ